ncbi:cytochrome c3 family protein [Engelhardtia mirabilis]|uniref:Cytochrome c7-like domain-containing protein n=1 Tax=Engelhardtia mirabilis TaxID=2528011 RepID=A0A518BH09_9BACT|nr:hypothetical protein Pla133_13340 [Planctomycetes bacterium Pla133]QDV00593.1 hypothetical protein Pla86_13330 [Planctomycetes bacterium Pla86]
MFHFPSWTLTLRDMSGGVLLLAPLYVIGLVWFGASPKTTDAGYQPTQPIPYSHKLHAGDLKIDCRYCHNTVEDAAHSAVPPTATCMNCHSMIFTESHKLTPLRESFETGEPIEWVRIHDLPDYAYFNHSAHVNRGVGCVSCHGRVDKMEVVWQHEPLSMGWCLDCHREPELHLRPQSEITNMDWAPANQREIGQRLKELNGINPPTNCSTCHR